MTGKRTTTTLVRRIDGGHCTRGPDALIVEEPLAIELDGTLVATTMRTPGDDHELAAGLCHSEGLLAGARVRQVRHCTDGASANAFNTVRVVTDGRHDHPVESRRLATTTTSSCGICGVEAIDELTSRLEPITDAPEFAPELLARVPDLVRPHQALFAETGAVHAAAAVDTTGHPVAVREDIGRHNAVDKLVGHMLLEDRLPATDLGLFVSGRASFEMVQKAWAAGFGTVVAVSAPSALAVDLARRAGITLAGFVRGDAVNLYTG